MSTVRTTSMAQDEDFEAVKHWAITHTPSLHECFAASSRLENQRAELRRTRDHNLRFHTDHFYRVLEIYQRNAKEKALLDFNIRDKHSWDEVIREAKDAEQKYNSKAKGLRGIGHKALRSIGDHAAVTSPWLKLLPSGEHTSVLCGGLKLVFAAAGRMSEIRQRILEALGDVPRTIAKVEKDLENFHADETLSDLVDELYIVTLTAIEGMMKWLVDKDGWKQIKAILLGPSYGKSSEEKIADLKTQLQSVQQRVDFLRDQNIVRTQETTADTNDSVWNIRSDVKNLKESYYTHSTMMEHKFDKLQSQNESWKGIVEHLHEAYRNSEWNRQKAEWRYLKLSRQLEATPHHSQMLISQQQLLDIFAVDSGNAVHDMELAIRQSMALDPSSQGQAYALLRSREFNIWLKSGTSRVLLVNGNSTSALTNRTSPISLICATLVQSLVDVQSVVCVQFFCGLHSSGNDSLSGPRGLMRSLISQLLLIQNFDLGFISSRSYRDQIHDCELGHLCGLFQTLVHQIPIDTVVFCVIDGISLYERLDWREETCYVVGKVREIAESPALSAIFKLLLTTPGRSRYIKEHISPQDQLVLPLDTGSNMPVLTGRRIAMQLRRPLVVQQSAPNLSHQHPFRGYQDSDSDTEDDDFDHGNLSD